MTRSSCSGLRGKGVAARNGTKCFLMPTVPQRSVRGFLLCCALQREGFTLLALGITDEDDDVAHYRYGRFFLARI